MNNIAILDNPYSEGIVISTNGVGFSSKVAKINDDKKSYDVTKKDRLAAYWEKNKPIAPSIEIAKGPKDYNSVLSKIAITAVNYAPIVDNSGAKKLRVNGIVKDKTSTIYNNVEKIDVISLKPDLPKIELQEETKVSNAKESVSSTNYDEIRGRHERTDKVPINEVKETLVNENRSQVVTTSRAERNAMLNEAKPAESKAGDMDLYNNLLHNVEQEDDVSKQLQGARNQLNIEKEENKKLAEQYGEAVKELEKLKEEIAMQRKVQHEKVQSELNATLKNIALLKEENLARTSDLTSIQAEIARLKAQRREMEDSNFYDDARSYGRAA